MLNDWVVRGGTGREPRVGQRLRSLTYCRRAESRDHGYHNAHRGLRVCHRPLGFESLEERRLLAAIDLASLGAGGTTIFGADAGDSSGFSVSGAGDVNGDGYDDMILGAYHANAALNAKMYAGESYLLFGGPTLPGVGRSSRPAARKLAAPTGSGARAPVLYRKRDPNGQEFRRAGEWRARK